MIGINNMNNTNVRSLLALRKTLTNEITKTDQYIVDFDLILEEEGFNPRVYDAPEVKEHIERLKEAYMAGEKLPAFKVQVVDGKILLRDGYCRRRGILLAREEGCNIQRVSVEEVKGDQIEQSMVILTSNDGLKLKALERASIYVRMKNLGLTEDEIAQKVHRTRPHIQQYLALYDLPIELKQLIMNGSVSWSLALSTFQEHGTKAISMLTKNDKTITDHKNNEKRITQKEIDKQNGYRSKITGNLAKDVSFIFSDIIDNVGQTYIEGDQHVTIKFSREGFDMFLSTANSVLMRDNGNGDEK